MPTLERLAVTSLALGFGLVLGGCVAETDDGEPLASSTSAPLFEDEAAAGDEQEQALPDERASDRREPGSSGAKQPDDGADPSRPEEAQPEEELGELAEAVRIGGGWGGVLRGPTTVHPGWGWGRRGYWRRPGWGWGRGWGLGRDPGWGWGWGRPGLGGGWW